MVSVFESVADERDRRMLYGAGLCLFTWTIGMLTMNRAALAGMAYGNIYLLALLIFGAALFYLFCISAQGIWSLSSVFVIVYSLFHLGMVLILAVGAELPRRFISYANLWWSSYANHYAIILVLIGLTAFISGVSAAHLIITPRQKDSWNFLPEGFDMFVSRVSFFMILVAVSVFFVNLLLSGGVSLLLGSYSSYIENSSTFLSGYHFYFNGLGLIFLAASKPSRYRRAGIFLYLLFALFALPLGLRGRVFFPMLVALSVAAMRKVPLSTTKTLLLGVCMLSAVTIFKQVRQVGLGEVVPSELSILPTEGLAEMGGSLRPVTEVVIQTDKGDDFLYGTSYLAPLDRSLVFVIPGWTRPPVSEDERFLAVRMSERVGPIGYSMVAEAYRNFGVLGVVTFLLAIGGLLGWMEIWPVTLVHQMRAGAIISPLLLEVRNSFIFVPSSIIIGLTVVFILKRIYGLSRRGEEATGGSLDEQSTGGAS